MKLSPPSRKLASPAYSAQRGYILITLILFVALLAIGLTALAPVITQQIKRDREEELIHRGTQYSRAIKHYMKKFSRYPTRIEELENTNNIHFLRKRYKDPVTGKDFKLLRMGDVQMSFGPGLAGATSAASLASGSAAGGNSSPFGGSGVFGGGPTGNSGPNAGSLFGGGTGGAFGGNAANPPAGGIAGQASNNNSDAGSDANANQAAGSPGSPGGQAGFGQSLQKLPGFNQQGTGSQGNSNPVFGGGPVVGVVSVSKEKTIRIFSKKEHYNEWQFIYDPSTDRGGLLTTPNQPAVQTGNTGLSGTSGAAGTQGASGSPFGSGTGAQNPPGGMAPIPQQSPYPQPPPGQSPQ